MVAGHLCLDVTPQFLANSSVPLAELFRPGKLVDMGSACFSTGGVVANTGLSLVKMGVNAVLNGKIGQDEFGLIVKRLVGPDRAASLREIEGASTSYSVVLAIPGVDRIFLHHTGANDDFTADDIDYKAAANCQLFHFGYPPLMRRFYQDGGDELARMLRRVKELGLTTCIDLALPDPASLAGQANWLSILQKALPYVDVFLPSMEEIAYMIDRDLFSRRKTEAAGKDPVMAYHAEDAVALADRLLGMGVKIVGVKMGIRGICLRTAGCEAIMALGKSVPRQPELWADRRLWMPSYHTDNFKSAVGAGDATIAGFLCGLVRGFSPEDTLRIAGQIGWQNVQAIDALSGLTDWDTTLRVMDENRVAPNPPHLQPDHWIFQPSTGVYAAVQDKRAGR